MAAAVTADSSRSSSTADSYIGSLISLTSKSEIRYEGILYNINTEESSIGLRNVRSFGTEGRKRDGPQVGPSDKVYEYILFRGSDIKDLQVKSSPPAQSTAPINSDPAIIQSHYPRPAATTSSLPAAAASGSLPEISSQTAQMGHPGSTFQGGLPLYQPGGNMGSWGPSPPPPNANGSGLAMPMYWPGFYGPPTGLPQLHQQSLLRPPPGLSMPPSMQQPMQYPGFNASLQSGASNLPSSNLPTSNFPNLSSSNLPTSNMPAFNLPTSNMPAFNLPTSNLPEYPSPLLPTSSASLTKASFPGPTLPSSLPPAPSISLHSETLPSVMTNKAPVPLGGSLPSLSPLTTSTPDVNAVVPPMSNKSNVSTGPSLPYQTIPHPISTIARTSAIQAESPTPSLITPGQLLQSGQGAVISSQSSQVAHKDVEVVQVAPTSSSEPLAPVHASTEAQPPILPLPTPSRTVPKMNGAPYQNRHSNYRGRERGRGTVTSRPVMKFTEEFDFTAMNEKFNKDEVWGHLGKSNRFNSKDKGDGNISDEDEYEDEDDTELSKSDSKPVYSKDDFFDTLSCNALDNQNNGRTRFSEQMKLDTETFGEFSRYRGGRGGRGPYRGGGRSRGGSYYGRGYGYNGRGRGGRTSNRDY